MDKFAKSSLISQNFLTISGVPHAPHRIAHPGNPALALQAPPAPLPGMR
ncbi:hypothetical protein D8I24_7570 (plasmid) [Cupriavidus necator H850]|nr:hypothetical protein D8I24_7570 [Cupriavidus necator H850]